MESVEIILKYLEIKLFDQFHILSSKMEDLIDQKFVEFHLSFDNVQLKQKENNQEIQEKEPLPLLDKIEETINKFEDFQMKITQTLIENQKVLEKNVESQMNQLLKLIDQHYIDEKSINQQFLIYENQEFENTNDLKKNRSPNSEYNSIDNSNPFMTQCTKPLDFQQFLKQHSVDDNKSQNSMRSYSINNYEEKKNISQDQGRQNEDLTDNLFVQQESNSFLFKSAIINQQNLSAIQNPNSTNSHIDRNHQIQNNSSFSASQGLSEYHQQYYITRTGKKYHRDGCYWLSWSKIPLQLNQMFKYRACRICLG